MFQMCRAGEILKGHYNLLATMGSKQRKYGMEGGSFPVHTAHIPSKSIMHHQVLKVLSVNIVDSTTGRK